MRIHEIADAEAQLGLLRTIIDNTWTAIAQQAEQQRSQLAKLKTAPKTTAQRTKAAARPSPAFKPVPVASLPTIKPITASTSSKTTGSQAAGAALSSPSVAKNMGLSSNRTQNLDRNNSVQRTNVDDSNRHS